MGYACMMRGFLASAAWRPPDGGRWSGPFKGIEMPALPLPIANYVEFAIANDTGTSEVLYISLVSETQAYKFTQYEASGGRTVYVAEVDTPTGSSVASIPLSKLVNNVDGRIGFYV